MEEAVPDAQRHTQNQQRCLLNADPWCLLSLHRTQVHAETGFNSMEEAVLLVTLEPETPYVVVPSLATPGVEAPFELRIMSNIPVELVPLPEVGAGVL